MKLRLSQQNFSTTTLAQLSAQLESSSYGVGVAKDRLTKETHNFPNEFSHFSSLDIVHKLSPYAFEQLVILVVGGVINYICYCESFYAEYYAGK